MKLYGDVITVIIAKQQIIERIIHFNSKDAMDIVDWEMLLCRKFYGLQLLKDIPEYLQVAIR